MPMADEVSGYAGTDIRRDCVAMSRAEVAAARRPYRPSTRFRHIPLARPQPFCNQDLGTAFNI